MGMILLNAVVSRPNFLHTQYTNSTKSHFKLLAPFIIKSLKMLLHTLTQQLQAESDYYLDKTTKKMASQEVIELLCSDRYSLPTTSRSDLQPLCTIDNKELRHTWETQKIGQCKQFTTIILWCPWIDDNHSTVICLFRCHKIFNNKISVWTKIDQKWTIG